VHPRDPCQGIVRSTQVLRALCYDLSRRLCKLTWDCAWLASALQNLCRDLGSSTIVSSAVGIAKHEGEVGRVDLEDCLLETMTGAYMLWVRPTAC
jgi:hypothetical protein